MNTNPIKLLVIACTVLFSAQQVFSQALYTKTGTERPWSTSFRNATNASGGVSGTKITVNKSLVEVGNIANRPLWQNIRIHTIGTNTTATQRKDFSKWSRWYQEDGNTSIFRLFKGENNSDSRPRPRVEAFGTFGRIGQWNEWSARYTIISMKSPTTSNNTAIFQIKYNKTFWAVNLSMDDGDLYIGRLGRSRVKIGSNMIGRSFDIVVRDNGNNYIIWMNGKEVLRDSHGGRGSGDQQVRWGLYNAGQAVQGDCMIFVSGVTNRTNIRPDDPLPSGGSTPPPQTYTLNTTVSGQGTVVKSPNRPEYAPGTEVTLTATPATGMVFTGWSGDATGTTNPLKVTMNANRTINALFMQKMPSGIEKLTIVSAEASAEQNDDHLKEFSYDGDPQTRWANDNTPENNWIIFDLGESRIVNVVKLLLNVGETRTYPLKVEVGESKDSFTEVWNADLPPAVGLNTIVLTEAAGRYVRVSMTGPNSDGSNWFSISQAEVWGTDQGTSIFAPSNVHTQFVTVNQIQGGFTVTAPGASSKLQLFDLKGKLLFQKSGVFENSFIPMRQNGLYFLRISQGERQINKKVVVKN